MMELLGLSTNGLLRRQLNNHMYESQIDVFECPCWITKGVFSNIFGSLRLALM